MQQIESIDFEKLIYIGETGFNDNIVVQYGWFEKDKKVMRRSQGLEVGE